MARTGRCLCGDVRYELRGELGPLVNCHCRFCRRAHGAAFVTVAWVRSADFRFTHGADRVQEFGTEGVGARAFCGRCGTRLFSRAQANPDFLSLVVASLDEDPKDPPVLHVNVESKAAWYEIRDDRPRFDGLPPAAARALEERSE